MKAEGVEKKIISKPIFYIKRVAIFDKVQGCHQHGKPEKHVTVRALKICWKSQGKVGGFIKRMVKSGKYYQENG